MNKFCSCYERIERRNASGATIQDMINATLDTYIGEDDENKPFTLMHCYHKLKDEDKWKSLRIEMAHKNKKQKTTKASTPSNVQSSKNDEVEEVAAPGSEERKRPKGQKQVKQARRDDASLAALEKMWEKKEARELERDKAREASLEIERAALEVEKAALELEKKRLSNEEKKFEAELLKEEKDIMLADKSSLDQDQLQWLEIMKKKILARHMGN
ncbi:uncharacterized protein LOC8079306 [Sorghum bicolor]|uniref:uncharacterized protein LOC8079306 n=1 Tax=Sorghum bicolor TaxID=4558 RepID=UPI0001A89303|nr:uncharacterized protein LOC8079306 [Sorghum bicolor]|eukprot:XP_002437190.1 uncharacterized protein LOC8079306 [Sorghum bicolor]